MSQETGAALVQTGVFTAAPGSFLARPGRLTVNVLSGPATAGNPVSRQPQTDCKDRTQNGSTFSCCRRNRLSLSDSVVRGRPWPDIRRRRFQPAAWIGGVGISGGLRRPGIRAGTDFSVAVVSTARDTVFAVSLSDQTRLSGPVPDDQLCPVHRNQNDNLRSGDNRMDNYSFTLGRITMSLCRTCSRRHSTLVSLCR